MKRTGFSLVELLVAIAIVALLLTILLPGFSEIRSLARQAKCVANLHHVGQAFEAAVGRPDEKGTISNRRYPLPRQWPGIPYNAEGTDLSATEGPAVDALNQSADAVESSIGELVPQELKDAFIAWADGSRAAAEAITAKAGPDEFNSTIDALNEARSRALRLCDATYR